MTPMNIECLVTGAIKKIVISFGIIIKLCYDPGDNVDQIKYFKKNIKHYRISLHTCTRGSYFALHDVHQQHPAPIGMYHLDWDWAFEEVNHLHPIMKTSATTCEGLSRLGKTSDMDFDTFHSKLSTRQVTLPVLFFYFNPNVTVGDTLFKGSCVERSPGGIQFN